MLMHLQMSPLRLTLVALLDDYVRPLSVNYKQTVDITKVRLVNKDKSY